MAITVNETSDSRQWSNGECTLRFIVQGTADDVAARDALLAAVPETHDGMPRDEESVTVEPDYSDTVEGAGIWQGEVHYKPPERAIYTPPETGDSEFNFDTTGGTQHITQARESISRTPTDTAPDFKGAIGVTKDSVDGVDITAPVYAFSETHYISAATVTAAYKVALFALTGKTNNALFKGLAAGECLFLGASGSMRAGGDWAITFKFAASPNRTNISIGAITVAAKKGWEYLWVRYTDVEDATAKVLVQRPLAAYVERVYDAGDFSGLGIGT